MFSQIKMIDYRKPLRARLELRKHCGPYTWTPTQPGKGRGFYQSGKGLACGDSTFDLRLVYANDVFPSYSRQREIRGYYCDEFQDSTLTPIIARLPHGRGYLAGWTMGANMIASLDAYIYADATDAALAAHSIAERDAEREREYQETEREKESEENDES